MESRRPAVMFVHGLPVWRDPTKGWVSYCRAAVLETQAEPAFFAYSRWTGLAALLRPQGRAAARLRREFLAAYARIRAAHGPPAVIAHSLGSYLVARALAEHARDVSFRGVVLFGSMVRSDFEWAAVIRRRQVPARRLRNEVGLHDWPLRWAALLARAGYPYGAAGLEGFRRVKNAPPIDYPYAGEPDGRGVGRYCREVWLPFLGIATPRARGGPP